MKITRRTALRQVAMITAGAALLPGCLKSGPADDTLFKVVHLNADQEDLLRSIAETIIPGCGETGVHHYMARMIDDCLSAADQATVPAHLDAFATFAKQHGVDFVDAIQTSRLEVLAALEKDQENQKSLYEFYQGARQLTIRGYTTSEFYLTKVQPYKMIPGKFQGCVKISA